jgi:hypothetical protein
MIRIREGILQTGGSPGQSLPKDREGINTRRIPLKILSSFLQAEVFFCSYIVLDSFPIDFLTGRFFSSIRHSASVFAVFRHQLELF